TVRLLEEQYVANASRVGEILQHKLEALKSRHKRITEIRGRGLMIGVQVATPKLRDLAIAECFRRGLLVLGAGASAIRLSPPLIIDEEQADFAAETLSDAIAAVS